MSEHLGSYGLLPATNLAETGYTGVPAQNSGFVWGQIPDRARRAPFRDDDVEIAGIKPDRNASNRKTPSYKLGMFMNLRCIDCSGGYHNYLLCCVVVI